MGVMLGQKVGALVVLRIGRDDREMVWLVVRGVGEEMGNEEVGRTWEGALAWFDYCFDLVLRNCE
jgi:hypothetical protein